MAEREETHLGPGSSPGHHALPAVSRGGGSPWGSRDAAQGSHWSCAFGGCQLLQLGRPRPPGRLSQVSMGANLASWWRRCETLRSALWLQF